ncbi:killer cell lectin-like receptor subfamily F member 1 [Mauremys reevesii]|uniref:killer cell lectin-like receptor subfamily F member 1 n=1 Tax=Mauremys reevesii TaxID=260615 RepID=UPI00193FD2E9|nr:killer cell lectin-like receptor subfamily F member 1 [Mauremys reevesii]
MQDEEGDMGLAPRPHEGSLSAAGNQAPCRHRHCLVALGTGWVTLTLAAIVLSRVGFQGYSQEHQTMPASRGPEDVGDAQRSGNGAECSYSLQDFRSHLRQSLCGLPQSSSAEGSGCKLCPRHWVPHMDKCYWLSEENQYWSWGRDDCSRRGSHLLMIQDREELEFIQNLTGNRIPAWIGLSITSPGRKWTWVDGSPLNQTLFTVSGPVKENSCAAVKKTQIKSEICNTDYKWICQKEAVLI